MFNLNSQDQDQVVEFRIKRTYRLTAFFLVHRLERDVETGGLQTRHKKRETEIRRGCVERGLDNSNYQLNCAETPTSYEVPTPIISSSASAGKTLFVYCHM